jgi:uncharacterized protein (DUF362 family)
MTQVALFGTGGARYASQPPFPPDCEFPELASAGIRQTGGSNPAYRAVREALALLGLDKENFGTPQWNPLRAYIQPGDKVVLKPNLVLHEFGPQKNAACLTTHGSVIRAALDYVYLAAGREGRISIADAPLQGADFARVSAGAGLPQIQQYYREALHCEIEVIDLRQLHAVIDEDSSLIRRVERLSGDPRGYCEIDLGQASRLHEVDGSHPHYVVGDYDAAATNSRHRGRQHSYVVSRTVLEADAVICLPKLKTHSKTGVTVCLKNMVGIIGSKDCLPHHRQGKSGQGGDEFAADYPVSWWLSARAHDRLQGRLPVPAWRFLRSLARTFLGAGTPHNGNGNGNGKPSGFYPSGGWHGNDTIWRTIDDLNQILFFYDPLRSAMQEQIQRRYFALVDGMVAMEGNGPLRGTPKAAGVVLAGDDPLAIDIAAATLMSFDWKRIRLLDGIAHSRPSCAYSACTGDLSDIRLLSNILAWRSLEALSENALEFHPPSGWREFVEMQHVE